MLIEMISLLLPSVKCYWLSSRSTGTMLWSCKVVGKLTCLPYAYMGVGVAQVLLQHPFVVIVLKFIDALLPLIVCRVLCTVLGSL